MALGMSYDQYWYGDVRMTKAFVEADKLKQERMNTEKWLQGLYFLNALSCVLDSNKTYPEKPYVLFERPKTEFEKRKEAEEEIKKAIAYFNSFAKHKKNMN